MPSLKQLLFISSLALSLRAQTSSNPTPTTQTPKKTPIVAGIPVNYDEAKVGTYTLPDPLTLANGKPVRDAKTWTTQRRPEILQIFETQQFGRAPGRPAGESFEEVEKATPALNGRAIRKQTTIYLSTDHTANGPQIHLVEYIPTPARKPVPMLLAISFGAVQNTIDDPGIKPQLVWNSKSATPGTRIMPPAGRTFTHIDILPVLAAGFGIATFYYGDVEPDFPAGFPYGIRARYLKSGQTQPAPDEWGAIAAWAWGMSRVMDYFETDPAVDPHRVAIHGVSRLGKTVLWAGATDQRFAAVIASCSGEGGAALSHRDYGETIAHITDPTRYAYQFAANYHKYSGFPDTAPMDANLLVSLIAPRPLLLQTGDTDFWSDPKGEFLAAVSAGPVYKLLGKDPLDTDAWPAANHPILHDLAYTMHTGGHGMVPADWPIYITFLTQHLHPDSTISALSQAEPDTPAPPLQTAPPHAQTPPQDPHKTT